MSNVCGNIICISFTSPTFCANLYIPRLGCPTIEIDVEIKRRIIA